MSADEVQGTGMNREVTDGLNEPAWAQELRRRFVSGEAALFLLHNAVQDWVDRGDRLSSLTAFLDEHLLASKTVVAHYNLATGITFPCAPMREMAVRLINRLRQKQDRPETDARILPREPIKAMEVLEDLLTACAERGAQGGYDQTAAVVLEFVETLVPSGDLLYLSETERRMLALLQRWTSAPFLLESNNIVLLIAEHRSQVHPSLVRDPLVVPIEIPLPTRDERAHALAMLTPRALPPQVPDLTAGLSRVQIQQLVRRLPESFDDETVLCTIREGKKQQIEQECAGLLEFVQPRHGFDTVGGMEKSKALLLEIAGEMRAGRLRRVPMGMMFVGPMGTGKTVLANAFARECGMNCVTLKNFRDKWVGATESNLEQIIAVLEAMGPIIVIIDEGDRAFGNESAEGDSGTSSRVMARLKAFMSDTSHRGYLLFILMTNRPDKLDVDLKRAGRLDIKIPFFAPQDTDELLLVLQALARKHQLTFAMDEESIRCRLAGLQGYAGSDLEALLLQASHDEQITEEEFDAAIADYIPSRDRDMVRYMELLAVFECSSRRLLPDIYRTRSTEELLVEMNLLRRKLGLR